MTYHILGKPGKDNALLVNIDSGNATEKLLFDCGDDCLTDLSYRDIRSIDHLFFSHLHMDHIGGFDHFFRCTYDRTSKKNQIWGPPQTSAIMQHRFQGFLWNLTDRMSATWHVSDIFENRICTSHYELSEGFATLHDAGIQQYEQTILNGAGYGIEAFTMNHLTPSIAYLIKSRTRFNLDMSKLPDLGLHPGPWINELKSSHGESGKIRIDGVDHERGTLWAALINETPGKSIAYLTDFLLDDAATERLETVLTGCDVIICEAQYRHSDLELARKNFHMTTVLSATLAKRAQAKELVLFHLSDRYRADDWPAMLEEARAIFPNTHYPNNWVV